MKKYEQVFSLELVQNPGKIDNCDNYNTQTTRILIIKSRESEKLIKPRGEI